MQTKQQIQALLAEAESQPRHRLGQNFMIDGNLLRIVAAAGSPSAGDLIVEVGPGTGSLTEELLETAAKVVAVEIDRDLAGLLRNRLGARENFTLIEGDALAGKHALCPQLLGEIAARGERTVKLVANLPYQIASPLVIELLVAGVDVLVFTVQKEVAWRLKATVGGEHYGPLSVMAALLSRVELLRTLPPQAFWPMPKIDSALVRMTREDRLGGRASEFTRFLHAVFSYRRKMLHKAMSEAGMPEAALEKTGFSSKMRPEELSPDQWLSLFNAVG